MRLYNCVVLQTFLGSLVSPFSERNAMFAEGPHEAFVTNHEITRDNLEGHNLRYFLT